jgi:hypothetical protein
MIFPEWDKTRMPLASEHACHLPAAGSFAIETTAAQLSPQLS